MKTAIIFGASGQDGYFLNKLLEGKSINVIKVSRNRNIIKGDISHENMVFSIVERIKPDYIFHFAATSSVQHKHLFDNHKSISTGTLNILEACLKFSIKTKIFLTGSAEQFLNESKPINEKTNFYPNNHYSVERIYSCHLARYYRNHFSMKIYIGYLFHHDSEYSKQNHLNGRIVDFVKKIEIKKPTKLLIGDFRIEKEFNYAKDIIDAIWLLINQNYIFETVIGSGKPYPISDWLELAFTKRKLDWKEWIELDPEYQKPYDKLFSDPSLIKSLGWEPKIDKDGLLNLMY